MRKINIFTVKMTLALAPAQHSYFVFTFFLIHAGPHFG